MNPVRGLFSDLLLHDMGQGLQAPSPAEGMLPATVERMTVPKFVVEELIRSRSVPFGYGISSVSPPVASVFPQPDQPQFPRGESIDDNCVTWDSLQREWRTAPLWGIADTAPYLHDGRASAIEEAIKWHGGESEAVKQRYLELARIEKDKLLTFLATLRAPVVGSE